MQTKRLSFILAITLCLAGASAAQAAFSYSNWGHKVQPVGADRYAQASQRCDDTTRTCFGYWSFWFKNNNGVGSPGGNTWTMTGGYCSNGSSSTWVTSSWTAPSGSLPTSGFVCPSNYPTPMGNSNAWVQVASEGYTSFTY